MRHIFARASDHPRRFGHSRASALPAPAELAQNLALSLGLAVALAIIAPPALAQEAAPEDAPLDWAQPLAGDYILSGNSEGDAYCALSLGDSSTIGGAALNFTPTCLQNFPLEEVAGWTLYDKDIAFIDALRQPVLRFTIFAEGSYSSDLPDGRGLSLERGTLTAEETEDLLFEASYTLSGPNRAEACGFMVIPEAADHGRIEQSGRCPSEWRSKDWARWRETPDKGLELLASDDSVILALEASDGLTFVAGGQDASAPPLYFGPGVIEGE